MKRVFFLILVCLTMCSCSELLKVPEQDVSFLGPPADWQRLQFTSGTESSEKGGSPVKIFMASWRKNNLSSISIMGIINSAQQKNISNRDSLLFGLTKETMELRKVCISFDYSITNEDNGKLREGIMFTSIEAEMKCKDSRLKKDINTKTVLYNLETSNYLYGLQYKALEDNYDKDYVVFKTILDSISFDKN